MKDDSKEVLTCPACGKDMEKIHIERANCHIDICINGCGGIYFDNREFKKFDENLESIDEIQAVLEGKTFKKVDETFKRTCPACGMKMVKNSTSILGEIIIDDCYSCGGKFLDCGELAKIRAEYPNEEARSKAVAEFVKSKMGSEYDASYTLKPAKQDGLNGLINKFF